MTTCSIYCEVRCFVPLAKDLMKGVARSNLKYEDFAKMQIPLPTKSKQQQIVDLESGIFDRVKEIEKIHKRIALKVNKFYESK